MGGESEGLHLPPPRRVLSALGFAWLWLHQTLPVVSAGSVVLVHVLHTLCSSSPALSWYSWGCSLLAGEGAVGSGLSPLPAPRPP